MRIRLLAAWERLVAARTDVGYDLADFAAAGLLGGHLSKTMRGL